MCCQGVQKLMAPGGSAQHVVEHTGPEVQVQIEERWRKGFATWQAKAKQTDSYSILVVISASHLLPD